MYHLGKKCAIQILFLSFLPFQCRSVPLRSDIKEMELPPANILIYPHFEEVRGGVEPSLMAHWKARVEFLLSVIELLFLSLTVEVLQGKMCQKSLPSAGVGYLEPRFQGRGRPWRIFFGFYKTRHILLSDSSNCTVLCAVVLTQYQRKTGRRTDRWTDRIAVASTALAM